MQPLAMDVVREPADQELTTSTTLLTVKVWLDHPRAWGWLGVFAVGKKRSSLLVASPADLGTC
jgi:hypothetical protein